MWLSLSVILICVAVWSVLGRVERLEEAHLKSLSLADLYVQAELRDLLDKEKHGRGPQST